MQDMRKRNWFDFKMLSFQLIESRKDTLESAMHMLMMIQMKVVRSDDGGHVDDYDDDNDDVDWDDDNIGEKVA